MLHHCDALNVIIIEIQIRVPAHTSTRFQSEEQMWSLVKFYLCPEQGKQLLCPVCVNCKIWVWWHMFIYLRKENSNGKHRLNLCVPSFEPISMDSFTCHASVTQTHTSVKIRVNTTFHLLSLSIKRHLQRDNYSGAFITRFLNAADRFEREDKSPFLIPKD